MQSFMSIDGMFWYQHGASVLVLFAHNKYTMAHAAPNTRTVTAACKFPKSDRPLPCGRMSTASRVHAVHKEISVQMLLIRTIMNPKLWIIWTECIVFFRRGSNKVFTSRGDLMSKSNTIIYSLHCHEHMSLSVAVERSLITTTNSRQLLAHRVG